MKVVAIIQARMSSKRLRGKVLMQLAGIPVLEHVVQRVSYCKTINQVVVATSSDISDDDIETWCIDHKVECFRGNLSDVLDRFYQAAKHYQAEAIVRITADCPVIDPAIVDEVVEGYQVGGFEFYGLAGEFPDGLDCTVFSFSAIERAWNESVLPSEREHVGPYIEKNPEIFKSGALVKFKSMSHHRWTLDEPDDFKLLSFIFNELYEKGSIFYTHQIIKLLEINPEISNINSNIIRNEGYQNSLLAEGSGRNGK
jgi:spore coat polysaccharide biosynthesis protein SpsF